MTAVRLMAPDKCGSVMSALQIGIISSSPLSYPQDIEFPPPLNILHLSNIKPPIINTFFTAGDQVNWTTSDRPQHSSSSIRQLRNGGPGEVEGGQIYEMADKARRQA